MNLGYFNRSLTAMYSDPTRLVADDVLKSTDITQFRRTGGLKMLEDKVAESTWLSLVDELVATLEHVRPRTIVAPHPLLDAAADHKLSTIALIEALGRVDPAQRTLLLYTNHHATSEYFPFGPANSLISLPPWTGKVLQVRGVYSHRLDEEARIRKLYALEAQHDLRSAPRYASPSPVGRVLGELARTLGELWRDPTDTYSYMRRAARPNELFLMFAEEDTSQLLSEVSGFLDGLRSPEPTEND